MIRYAAAEEEWRMRGTDRQQSHLFSYVSPEDRVPADHPLRPIRAMVDAAFARLSPRFAALYSHTGRPSVPPEKLLRALLLQVFYSVRSEALLMEQLDYNLLFRWFVGFNIDEVVWDATTFTKNRNRLLKGDIAQEFFTAVLDQARGHGLLSDEHFTVDGTLLEAWASQKSFQRTDQPPPPSDGDPGNPTVNFHGERRSNATHASTTDPDSRLCRKGKGREAKLAYLGNLLMDNREGLAMAAQVSIASGAGETLGALELVEELTQRAARITVGADKAYDNEAFVLGMRFMDATPHVAQNTTGRRSRIDARTTTHAGYAISQVKRKRIEEIFGWLKTVALLRKLRHRGRATVEWIFTFAVAAYNLVRIRNLTAGVT
jgi:transposase